MRNPISSLIHATQSRNSQKNHEPISSSNKDNANNVDGYRHQVGCHFHKIQAIPPLPPIKCTNPNKSDRHQVKPLSVLDYERDYRNQASDLELVERVFNAGMDSNQLRAALWPYLFGLVKHRGRFRPMGQGDSNDTLDYVYEEHEKNLDKWRELEQQFHNYQSQWRSIQADQELRFSVFRERKSLIERDVIRSDRTHPFYADNSQNLSSLSILLMTYMMYDFDIGYLQGMSDIAAPILYVFNGNLVKSFWIFVEVMKLFRRNFEESQKTIHFQLACLYRLIKLTDPNFAQYLNENECSNCFFTFRCIVCKFKRELMRSTSSPNSSSSTGDNSSGSELDYGQDYSKVLNLWDTIWSVQRRHELLSNSKYVHTFTIANGTSPTVLHSRRRKLSWNHMAHIHPLNNNAQNQLNNHHFHNNNQNSHKSIAGNRVLSLQKSASLSPTRNGLLHNGNALPNGTANNNPESNNKLNGSSQQQNGKNTSVGRTIQSNGNSTKPTHKDQIKGLSCSCNIGAGKTLTRQNHSQRHFNSSPLNKHSNGSSPGLNSIYLQSALNGQLGDSFGNKSNKTNDNTNAKPNGNSHVSASPLSLSPSSPMGQPIKQEQVVYTKETYYSSFDPNQADVPRFELTETEKFIISLCLALIRRERNYIMQHQLDSSEIHQHFINPKICENFDTLIANAHHIYHFLNSDCDLQLVVKGANELDGCCDFDPTERSSDTADTFDLLRDYLIISPTSYNTSRYLDYHALGPLDMRSDK